MENLINLMNVFWPIICEVIKRLYFCIVINVFQNQISVFNANYRTYR
jgi:hypothetical protein